MTNKNVIIGGGIIGVILLVFFVMVGSGMINLTFVGQDFITKNYESKSLEVDDGVVVEKSPVLRSGEFIFSAEAPTLSEKGNELFPPTETEEIGVVFTKEEIEAGAVAGPDKELVTTDVLRTTGNIPKEYWDTVVTISGEQFTFKFGETKAINDCFSVQMSNDGFADYRGTTLLGYDTKWLLAFKRSCFFTEPTSQQTQIEFQEPFTSRISFVNLIGYEFAGGVEGKVEEIGLFTQTEFIDITREFDLERGCTIIPIEVPTDQIRKVQVQFNPIIKFSDGQDLFGTPFRWIYDRRDASAINEVVSDEPYSCPTGGQVTQEITTINVPDTASGESNTNLVNVGILIALFIAVLGMAIYLFKK